MAPGLVAGKSFTTEPFMFIYRLRFDVVEGTVSRFCLVHETVLVTKAPSPESSRNSRTEPSMLLQAVFFLVHEKKNLTFSGKVHLGPTPRGSLEVYH